MCKLEENFKYQMKPIENRDDHNYDTSKASISLLIFQIDFETDLKSEPVITITLEGLVLLG
jgi:hypothetical protein